MDPIADLIQDLQKVTSPGGATIQMGTVGWDNAKDHFFLGTEENDGYTMVRVQLYAGRDHSEAHKPDVAQGRRIICQLSGGLFRIPKKGTRCFVILPEGMEQYPGAGVIVATVEKTPFNRLNGDRAVMDFGDDTHVVIKGKSVSISDPENRFISVGTPRSGRAPGLTFQAADGSGGVVQNGVVSWFVASGGDAKTIIQMTPTKMQFLNKADSAMTLEDDKFLCTGSSCYVTGGAVYLGKAPTAANFAVWGPAGIAGVASPSVFISPV